MIFPDCHELLSFERLSDCIGICRSHEEICSIWDWSDSVVSEHFTDKDQEDRYYPTILVELPSCEKPLLAHALGNYYRDYYDGEEVIVRSYHFRFKDGSETTVYEACPYTCPLDLWFGPSMEK